jgi:uncharacterized protein Yka (UPF0111/DUF47 family)
MFGLFRKQVNIEFQVSSVIVYKLTKFFAILYFTGNFKELVEYLNDSAELLAKNINILDNVLETLDYQQHSLGILYILVAKISEIQVCTKKRKFADEKSS